MKLPFWSLTPIVLPSGVVFLDPTGNVIIPYGKTMDFDEVPGRARITTTGSYIGQSYSFQLACATRSYLQLTQFGVGVINNFDGGGVSLVGGSSAFHNCYWWFDYDGKLRHGGIGGIFPTIITDDNIFRPFYIQFPATKAPVSAGDIGMDVTTGRIQMKVGGGVVNVAHTGEIGPGTDEKVKIDSNDTTPKHLADKLLGTTNRISRTVNNSPGDETLSLDCGSDIIDKTTAGQVNGMTLKGLPVNNDILLIEDSAASYAKKKITIGSLPSGGGASDHKVMATDTDPVPDYLQIQGHINQSWYGKLIGDSNNITLDIVANPSPPLYQQVRIGIGSNVMSIMVGAQIYNLSAKASPVDADVLLIESQADTWAKKKITWAQIKALMTGKILIDATDTTADYMTAKLLGTTNRITKTIENSPGNEDIKLDVGSDILDKTTSGQLASLTVKGTPVSADILLIEDSAASNAKKKATVGSLPFLTALDGKAKVSNVDTTPDYLVSKILGTTNKITVTKENPAGNEDLKLATGTDIMDKAVSDQLSGLTEKVTPVANDLLLLEDSAASGAKKKVKWSTLPGSGSGTPMDLGQTNAAGPTTATSSFVDMISLAFTPLYTKKYKISWYCEVATSIDTDGVEVRIRDDTGGVDYADSTERMAKASAYAPTSGHVIVALTASATKTWKLSFKQVTGGTATCKNAWLTIERCEP